MAEYAKRTCHGCGIRLPQPQFHRLEIERTGVRGNSLPPRTQWICDQCFPHFKMKSPVYRFMAEQEALRAERDREDYQLKKRAWSAEQEQRRLANLAKKQP